MSFGRDITELVGGISFDCINFIASCINVKCNLPQSKIKGGGRRQAFPRCVLVAPAQAGEYIRDATCSKQCNCMPITL